MTDPAYFEEQYARSADPWDFERRWYDRRRYAVTLACLPRERYRSAFEPGCSVGVLSGLLVDRCDRLLASDAVAAAVARTRKRLGDRARVERLVLPRDWPAETFDLIVLSELGYYFDDADLAVLLDRVVAGLEPGGDLVAVHWRHPVAEHVRSGDEVHARIAERQELHRICRHEEEDFLAEAFTRVPPAPLSVARRDGLV